MLMCGLQPLSVSSDCKAFHCRFLSHQSRLADFRVGARRGTGMVSFAQALFWQPWPHLQLALVCWNFVDVLEMREVSRIKYVVNGLSKKPGARFCFMKLVALQVVQRDYDVAILRIEQYNPYKKPYVIPSVPFILHFLFDSPLLGDNIPITQGFAFMATWSGVLRVSYFGQLRAIADCSRTQKSGLNELHNLIAAYGYDAQACSCEPLLGSRPNLAVGGN